MIKKSLVISLFCSLFFAVNATENGVKTEKPLKIKVIKGKDVVTQSLEGKQIEKRIKEVRDRLEKDIKKLDAEIEKDLTELRAKARAVDQEALEKEQSKIVEKKKNRDTKAESAQEELTRTVNHELSKLNKKIAETIIDEAKKNDLDIVIVKESGEVVYNSDKVDFTNEIIKAQDAKYKTKAAAPKAVTEPKAATTNAVAGA